MNNQRILAITARDKQGHYFILTVRNPEWVPMEIEDIGKLCEPIKLITVQTESRVIYKEPRRDVI